MREIIFRGRRLDNGEWVYGSILVIEDTYFIIEPVDFSYNNDTDATAFWFDSTEQEVDPATVGQYTGLKDKNGKDIYEGDKLLINGNATAVVVWRNEGFDILDTCAWTPTSKGDIEGFVYMPTKTMKILSNIHNNPELLKTE